MSVQTDYDEIYAKRLAAIEKDPALTILSSMDQARPEGTTKATQYIVYTDYKANSSQTRFTISVYTPFENVDKYGHSKADFQSQLLVDVNRWSQRMHITVLETLGSESRLAFYDFQNMGLAQLALKAFVNLASRKLVSWMGTSALLIRRILPSCNTFFPSLASPSTSSTPIRAWLKSN